MNPDSNSNSEFAALQRQVFYLLAALIVVSCTLTFYIYWQARVSLKDINALRPEAERVIKIFNENQALMVDFEKQLIAYAQTHPDFRPILIRNGINPMPLPTAPATPAKP
jgi:hypothetical protein